MSDPIVAAHGIATLALPSGWGFRHPCLTVHVHADTAVWIARAIAPGGSPTVVGVGSTYTEAFDEAVVAAQTFAGGHPAKTGEEVPVGDIG